MGYPKDVKELILVRNVLAPFHLGKGWKGSSGKGGLTSVNSYQKLSAYSQPTNTKTSYLIGGLAFKGSSDSNTFLRQPTLHTIFYVYAEGGEPLSYERSVWVVGSTGQVISPDCFLLRSSVTKAYTASTPTAAPANQGERMPYKSVRIPAANGPIAMATCQVSPNTPR